MRVRFVLLAFTRKDDCQAFVRHGIRRLELERDVEMPASDVELPFGYVETSQVRVSQRALGMPFYCFLERGDGRFAQTDGKEKRSEIVEDAEMLRVLSQQFEKSGLSEFPFAEHTKKTRAVVTRLDRIDWGRQEFLEIFVCGVTGAETDLLPRYGMI